MKKRKIAIVGGGTAGWMTALIFHQQWKKQNISIELIESQDIGTIGVGEGSTPALKLFFSTLGISEEQWMPKCNATYKCGITFKNWSTKPGFSSYNHPFLSTLDGKFVHQFVHATRKRRAGWQVPAHPDDYFLASLLIQQCKAPISKHLTSSQHSYGYHLDATLLGTFLRSIAIERGIIHQQDTILDVKLDKQGNINTLQAASGRTYSADLYVDCTGFSSLLIGKSLENKFISYSDVLLNDYAVTLAKESKENSIAPHTTATALSAGWAWDIPLTNRHGCGYVFSSQFISPDQAQRELRQHFSLLSSPTQAKLIKMKVGRHRFHWKKNCVAIGLSQGFIEPLEANALTISQQSAALFATLYEKGGFSNDHQEEFNRHINSLFDGIRDYIVTHYKINSRTDSDYWKANRTGGEKLSASLLRLFHCWNHSLDLTTEIKNQNISHCFPSFSWYCLFAGNGCFPPQEKLQPYSGRPFEVAKMNEFYTKCADFYEDHFTQVMKLHQ